MNRLLAIALMVLLTALFADPAPAHAGPCPTGRKCTPRLVMKTASLALSYSQSSPGTGAEGEIAFGNRGSTLLLWRFYTGSEFGGCPVESPQNWLDIKPETGWNAPGEDSTVTVRVDGDSLPVGTHTALICLVTNDPRNELVPIPLTVEVTE